MRLRYLLCFLAGFLVPVALVAGVMLGMSSSGPAAAATSAAARPPGGQVITIPYCQKHPPADLCLESMGLHVGGGGIKGGDLDVIAAVRLKTNHTPKTLELKVQEWYKTLHGWIADGYRFYRVHDLPKPGHEKWLSPGVRSECATGKWELVMTFLGHTSKGNIRLETFYWPGSRTRKNKVIASDSPAGVNSRYWPGYKLKCGIKKAPRRVELAAAAAHHHARQCPFAASACVFTPGAGPAVGSLVVDSRASFATPWMVTDHNLAPMAWVDLFGLYSGGDGGKMPGGLICVTYAVVSTAACLTPTGNLELRATGPNGPTGPAETLTPADIAWIHQQGG